MKNYPSCIELINPVYIDCPLSTQQVSHLSPDPILSKYFKDSITVASNHDFALTISATNFVKWKH